MSQESLKSVNNRGRRQFIGGSDARTIMGEDEAAVLHLWREKRGDVEVVTEPLNCHWFERDGGQVLIWVHQHNIRHRMSPVGGSRAYKSGNVVTMETTRPPLSASGEEQYSCGYLRLRGFRKRTPSPPPFSSMNSIPAVSIARCSFPRASSETRGPNPPSSRLTVGRDSPARLASSD
jgi:hypothetical protein